MSDRRSYPSPNAATTRSGAAPFYGNGDLSPGGDADLKHLQDHLQLDAHINPDLQNSGAQPVDVTPTHHPHHQELAQSVMSLAQQAPTPGFQVGPQQVAPETPGGITQGGKSRSKVSRACDECRRKKIRCDATAENETSSCTSCKKSNQICQFSRTPQKRGPSKGYIKELADRVSSLEGQLKHEPMSEGHDGSRLLSEDAPNLDYETVQTTGGSTKRTHSMSEGLNDHYSASQRSGFPPQFQHENNMAIELDEGLTSLYYQYIHATVPILPDDINVLRSMLADTPAPSSNALLSAMEATVRSVQYSGVPDMSQGAFERAYELLNRSTTTDTLGIGHIQALLFLTIEATNRGGVILHGGNGRDCWKYLNEAAHEARKIGIFDCGPVADNGHPASDLILVRQIYFSIGILDSFMSFANKKAGSALLPRLMVQHTSDKKILGQRAYWLGYGARRMQWMYSKTITPTEKNRLEHDEPFRAFYTGTTISADDTDRLRSERFTAITTMEDFKDAATETNDPILVMAYLYWLGQIELHFYPIANIKELMHLSKRLVQFLSETTMVNPLTHHFAGFAAHTLFQLAEFVDTRDEALKHIDSLELVLTNLVPHSDSQSFEAAIRDTVLRKRAALVQHNGDETSPTLGGLEHLANAAVSTTATPVVVAVAESDGGVAAAAEAAAKAAQLHMGAQLAKGSLLSRDGYLVGFLT